MDLLNLSKSQKIEMSYCMYNITCQEDKSQTVVEKLPTTMENWDNDNAGTYNPTEHIEKKMIVRCLIGASKSKKKAFKKKERLRILKLLECELPFLNTLKELKLEDDSIWEQISHFCKLKIHDCQISDEALRQEFMRMKISLS